MHLYKVGTQPGVLIQVSFREVQCSHSMWMDCYTISRVSKFDVPVAVGLI